MMSGRIIYICTKIYPHMPDWTISLQWNIPSEFRKNNISTSEYAFTYYRVSHSLFSIEATITSKDI